jgi:hypothetical protein
MITESKAEKVKQDSREFSGSERHHDIQKHWIDKDVKLSSRDGGRRHDKHSIGPNGKESSRSRIGWGLQKFTCEVLGISPHRPETQSHFSSHGSYQVMHKDFRLSLFILDLSGDWLWIPALSLFGLWRSDITEISWWNLSRSQSMEGTLN